MMWRLQLLLIIILVVRGTDVVKRVEVRSEEIFRSRPFVLRFVRRQHAVRAEFQEIVMASDANVMNQELDTVNGRARLLDKAKQTGGMPGLEWTARAAHWLLRIPLAALIWQYGMQKFPSALTNPGDFGVPAFLYTLNAFAEVLGVIALIVGGVVQTWRPRNAWISLGGDLLTRSAGFALTAAVGGVIVFFHLNTLTLNSPHLMYFGLAAYFLLRGNTIGVDRAGR
ncbi:MAG: hypothetical protein AAGJ52_02940 [Pseudomonadota bacterium]